MSEKACSVAYCEFLKAITALPVAKRAKQAQILWDTLQNDVPVWFETTWPPSRKRGRD